METVNNTCAPVGGYDNRLSGSYVGDCLCGGMVIVEEVMKVVVIYAVVMIMVRTTGACKDQSACKPEPPVLRPMNVSRPDLKVGVTCTLAS